MMVTDENSRILIRNKMSRIRITAPTGTVEREGIFSFFVLAFLFDIYHDELGFRGLIFFEYHLRSWCLQRNKSKLLKISQ
jgi:hypothetical protein